MFYSFVHKRLKTNRLIHHPYLTGKETQKTGERTPIKNKLYGNLFSSPKVMKDRLLFGVFGGGMMAKN